MLLDVIYKGLVPSSCESLDGFLRNKAHTSILTQAVRFHFLNISLVQSVEKGYCIILIRVRCPSSCHSARLDFHCIIPVVQRP